MGLVVKRRLNEVLTLSAPGLTITVKVDKISGGDVSLWVNAPEEVRIVRGYPARLPEAPPEALGTGA